MNTYQIEFTRTSYTTICVDAQSKEMAEMLAWIKVAQATDVNDSDWEISFIEEQA